MTRVQAIQQLVRSARRLAAGDSCSLVPQRLLSNSQASTSAASDGPDRDRRPAGRRPAQSWQPRDSRAPRNAAAQTESYSPRNAQAASATSEHRGCFSPKRSGQMTPYAEPDLGFVVDGPFPYDASRAEIINLAGSTETAWEFLGAVDEECVTWFGMDFTRSTLPEVERNALLSNDAKEMMYQMHKHDDVRYSVPELASTFKIRQQRVMAILALKGMEHGDIPINPGKKKPSKAASKSTALASAEAPPELTTEEPTAQDSTPEPESEEQLDVRAQAVKKAMAEAAKEVPRYLKSITKQSDSWQVQAKGGTPKEQATDSSILTAWLKSMVQDPFWVRPNNKEEDEDSVPDISAMEDKQDRDTMSREDEEVEQQFLQDYYQGQQRSSRMTAEAQEEPNTPEAEGYQRYLLSDPNNLHHVMAHDVWDCHEATGTGERHVKFIPRYPSFEFVKDERPETLAAEEEAAAAGGQSDIERPVVSFWEEANRLQADQEEKHLVQEFRERLRYNLQQDGAKLDRRSRSKHLPSRPAAGWSMVVQDVSQEGSKKQYVALPDGKTRSLNADEKVYLERMQPKRRKRIV